MTKEYYSFSVPVRKFWRVYVPLAIAAVVLGGLLAVLVVDLLIMPGVAGIKRGTVKVPEVAGLSFEQGREALYGVGLYTEVERRVYDDNTPPDVIISQSPLAGEKVKSGRRIQVIVSKGEEFGVIPRVQDMTERQARLALKRAGFSIGSVRQRFDHNQPAEQAIGTSPSSGTTISRGMKVDLLISKGPRPTSTEMPNIVGESLVDAESRLEELGLLLGAVRYQNDPSLVPGTVIAQSLSPGKSVPFQTAVNLTVSVQR